MASTLVQLGFSSAVMSIINKLKLQLKDVWLIAIIKVLMWKGNSFVFERCALGYGFVLMVAIHMAAGRTSNYFRMHFKAIHYQYNGQHFFPTLAVYSSE